MSTPDPVVLHDRALDLLDAAEAEWRADGTEGELGDLEFWRGAALARLVEVEAARQALAAAAGWDRRWAAEAREEEDDVGIVGPEAPPEG